MKHILAALKTDHMKNSLYLVANSVLTAGLGFIFWMISARIFTSEEIGLASNLVSLLGIILTISLLGFDEGIIKYLRRSSQKKLISTSLVFTSLLSLIIASIAVIVYSRLYKKIGLFSDSRVAIIFIVSCTLWLLFTLIESVYIAKKQASLVLIKNTIFSLLKISLLVFFVSYGFWGIFYSWIAASVIGLITIVLIRPVDFSLSVDFAIIKKVFAFTSANHLANVMAWFRTLMLPLLITYFIDLSSAAYFFIALNIAIVFVLVPKALAKSLFAELEDSSTQLKQVFTRSWLLFLLSVSGFIFIVFFFGKYILLGFGREYVAGSLQILKILSVAGLFSGTAELFLALLRVTSRLKVLLLSRFIELSALIIFVISFSSFGLLGVSTAWLLSEALVAAYLFIKVRWVFA